MAEDERSWSRALMASSGVALDHGSRAGGPSHEWLEAGAADLARPRLLEFASHREVRIRETIALRPDCPTGVLATLAFDADRSVRRAVASNLRLAGAIASELIRDRDQEVLKALARNPAVDESIVTGLARHRRAEVRRAALRALEQRAEVAATGRGSLPSVEERIPPELRDRWRPPRADASPASAARANAYAPRPSVPPRIGAATGAAAQSGRRMPPSAPQAGTFVP